MSAETDLEEKWAQCQNEIARMTENKAYQWTFNGMTLNNQTKIWN